MIFYQYPKCSTCRKAKKWLDANGIDYTPVHIVDDNPDAERVRELWQASGLPIKRFFNTSGQVYRSGGYKDRLADMSDDDKLEALGAEGKLLKRPILEHDGGVLVGFKEETWADALL